MIRRESVKSRLKSANQGISFCEFSYQALQAFDWYHLLHKHQCHVQVGGGDQLGNMIAGYEFIRDMLDERVLALTVPLLQSDGHKMGKSTGSKKTIWLDPGRTSVFEFYQYFLRLPDHLMEEYLTRFTFLPDDQIADIVSSHKLDPNQRQAQKILAEQVTLLVHGEAGVAKAKRTSDVLFNSSADTLKELTDAEMLETFSSFPTVDCSLSEKPTVLDLAVKANCFYNAGYAYQAIECGGLSINFIKESDPDRLIEQSQHVLPNGFSVLRTGKRFYLVKWTNM